MKVHLLTLFALLTVSFSGGQVFGQESSDWTPYFENDAVTIELKHAERNDSINGIYSNYILIRLVNKTDQAVNAGFRKELSYNLEPAAVTDAVTHTIPPHVALEGSVEPGTDNSLRIFVNQRGAGSKKVLTDYSLSHIETSFSEN
jgi:hypothetical protein